MSQPFKSGLILCGLAITFLKQELEHFSHSYWSGFKEVCLKNNELQLHSLWTASSQTNILFNTAPAAAALFLAKFSFHFSFKFHWHALESERLQCCSLKEIVGKMRSGCLSGPEEVSTNGPTNEWTKDLFSLKCGRVGEWVTHCKSWHPTKH